MDERIKIIPKFACPMGHEHGTEQDANWCLSLQSDLYTVSVGFRDMEENLRNLEERLGESAAKAPKKAPKKAAASTKK